ncbi:hypothetical protein SAMN03080601_02876 [Alkalitalea saponilacus]|uniref:Uncharacterized protein n=1 Tax=Alkalitalea saponilacus TaxID=889453 RepID=A0A1T5HSB8_9BACT|nr:hypothetical protein SAMN03080601_02876 [Alkalitalea saponilacus]
MKQIQYLLSITTFNRLFGYHIVEYLYNGGDNRSHQIDLLNHKYIKQSIQRTLHKQ